MQTLTHGGDWMGYRERFGHDALDFSANVSPLGLPEGVANAIMGALPAADRYPDPLCRTLRAALEQAEGVPAPHILCGNGAADLIFRLVMAAQPRQALVLAPTFAEYAAALETVHCKVKRYYLSEENEFAVTDDLLASIDEELEMVFLCQPNNPTGQLMDLDLVRRIAEKCAAYGIRLVAGRVLPRFFARLRSPHGKASAGSVPQHHPPQSLYQALRHGGRPAGLLLQRR